MKSRGEGNITLKADSFLVILDSATLHQALRKQYHMLLLMVANQKLRSVARSWQ